MTDFLQLFFSGLSTGAIYALAALGFTLLWQASGTINFAQGEFVMLPAFMMLAFLHAGAPLPASFALTAVVAVGLLGWAFKRGLVDPLFKYGMMPIVVATIGLSIALRNGHAQVLALLRASAPVVRKLGPADEPGGADALAASSSHTPPGAHQRPAPSP